MEQPTEQQLIKVIAEMSEHLKKSHQPEGKSAKDYEDVCSWVFNHPDYERKS